MSETHAEDIRKHVRVYIWTFCALAVLTVVTVLAAKIQVSVALAIGIGLLIAVVKGSLVALFFMHLSHDWKLLYWTLLLTAVFFFALLLLPLLTYLDSFESGHFYESAAATG